MSETRTVSPTLEERLAAALLKTVRNFYAPESWMDGSWAEPEMLSDVRAYATPYFLAAAKEHGLVIGQGELDVAWKEAEAALPEGWNLLIGNHRSSGMNGWWATASEPFQEATRSYQIVSTTDKHRPTDPTPTAALKDLAAKLRDSRR